uniref:Solute carrier family 37 member 1 n=1 Tax=Sinocyclocheilus grahami TaxID=75366 RepID=A0A672M2Q8_SINGR
MRVPTESSSSQQPVLHPELDCSWKPFDRNNYKQLLGAMDYSFLCAYAIGMYLSGIIGGRLPIRLYLTVGMLSSGLFTCLFGLGYVYDIHCLGFYIFVQVANGLVQTTGWPSVVTCIGNWFGKVICFLFLIERKLGEQKRILKKKKKITNLTLLLGQESIGVCVSVQQVVVVKSEAEPSAISFMGALRIPGVVEFSLCLLFAKLVSYTFLFWLPFYITKAAHLDAKKAGDLSTLFDVGGIVGGILAGVISDKMEKRATTCAVMLLLAAPTLYGFSMMSQFGLGPTIGKTSNPNVSIDRMLITTAVSADLGTHKSLKGNARALSTVTAIIDGTGSIGVAVGPLLAGLLSSQGWDQVFYMLMTADFLALLFLETIKLLK